VWQNKYPPKIFVVISSHLEFQREIFSTYIYLSYAHKMYFKVTRITVTSSSDFSVLENFHREMHSWISHAEQESAVWISLPKMTKYAGRFHFEIPSDWWVNCKKKSWGILFAAPVCYTSSSLKSILILVYALLSRTVPLTPSLYLVSETNASPEFLDSLFLRPAVRHPNT